MENHNKSPKQNGVQQSLMTTVPLIEHSLNGEHIHQRPKDGYINATEMCKASKRMLGHYLENQTTKEFIKELSRSIGIPIDLLIQKITTGTNENRGTWVHPDLAVNLGQWLSPKFAVWVSRLVNEWNRGNVSGFMPPHVQRYIMNKSKIPPSHFSMLNEIYLELLAPIDDARIRIPSSMMPDISTGKMFSKFLRDKGIEAGEFPTYKHEFPDGRVVEARLYPIEHLGEFRKWLYEEWLPNKAISYFESRLPSAVPHIQHLLPPPKKRK